MSHLIRLTNWYQRQRAKDLIDRAPDGYIMKVDEPRRTCDQNAKLWAMLTDISHAKPLGRRHTPDDWKAIFMNACGWECQFVEGIDGRPFPKGFKSSELSKSQMSSLIDFMRAFGDQHGVRWGEEARAA
ncbi:MAG: recombination protein NinB [Sphingobium sp.]|nr:recombination protein NinB [Sphingobium sp.]